MEREVFPERTAVESPGMAADGRRGRCSREQHERWMEVERMAAWWSGGSCGGGLRMAASRWQRRRTVAGARCGGGGSTKACGGGGGSWTLSLVFLEQPLERESTPFFLQMTARVCGGVPSPLIEPIMGREGKWPT